jgi:uncharacterized membrane protein required for colicin V production
LILWLGWSSGLTRTFFSILSGFVAIVAANKYPDNYGVNFYLVFSIAALFVIMLGSFTVKIVNFFYLNLLDKLLGAFLSVAVWCIIAVNVVVPTMTNASSVFDRTEKSVAYNFLCKEIHSKFPTFRNYVPSFLDKASGKYSRE